MNKRLFSTTRSLFSHENPLGLPRAGTPPRLASRMARGLPEKRPIANVRHVIAVSSAKGGVGKSTIAANLALAFTRLGLRSGILDTDIFGPSIPTLFNLLDAEEPRLTESGHLIPLTNYGVPTMSMGYLLPKPSPTSPAAGSPVAWRGAMVQKALQQLLFSVAWPSTDILVLDLPPGTGDTQLTITQSLTLSGAIIVSTPQDLALADVVRGIALFQAPGVGARILGAVQNMSVFVCPKCGEETNVFGQDGLRRKCEGLGVEVLGDVPLDARICEDADRGKPTVVSEPGGMRAERYLGIARRVAKMVGVEVKN